VIIVVIEQRIIISLALGKASARAIGRQPVGFTIVMNDMRQFAFTQGDFCQADLRAVTWVVRLQGETKSFRRAPWLSKFQKTFADAFKQTRVSRRTNLRQAQRR